MKTIPRFVWATAFIALALFAKSQLAVAQDVNVGELFAKAQVLIQDEQYSEAADLLAQCVKADDNFGQGWFLYGYALHMDKKYEQAIKAHRRASEFDDERFQATAIYNLACALALTGQPEESLETLQRAVDTGLNDSTQITSDSDLFSLHTVTPFAVIVAKLNGNNETAEQLEQAQAAIEQEEFAKAAELYQAIVEREPKNDFACYRLGYALHGAGKLDEAIVYHEKASQLRATKGIGFYNWGCALSLKGEKEAAIAKLEEAIDHGFLRKDAYESDTDLDSLRDLPAFDELIKRVDAKLQEANTKTDSGPAEGSEASEVASSEMANGDQPPKFFLGLQMQVDEKGVYVVDVMEGSAAQRDWLKAGDRLLKVAETELGSEPIAVLRPYLASGDAIPFELQRDGKTLKIEVKPNPR